jgi:hypothetical protein
MIKMRLFQKWREVWSVQIRAGKSSDNPQLLLSTIVHAINHSMATLLTFSSTPAIGIKKNERLQGDIMKWTNCWCREKRIIQRSIMDHTTMRHNGKKILKF